MVVEEKPGQGLLVEPDIGWSDQAYLMWLEITFMRDATSAKCHNLSAERINR